MAYLTQQLHEICSFYFKFPVAYKKKGITEIKAERNIEDLLIELSDFIRWISLVMLLVKAHTLSIFFSALSVIESIMPLPFSAFQRSKEECASPCSCHSYFSLILWLVPLIFSISLCINISSSSNLENIWKVTKELEIPQNYLLITSVLGAQLILFLKVCGEIIAYLSD